MYDVYKKLDGQNQKKKFIVHRKKTIQIVM